MPTQKNFKKKKNEKNFFNSFEDDFFKVEKKFFFIVAKKFFFVVVKNFFYSCEKIFLIEVSQVGPCFFKNFFFYICREKFFDRSVPGQSM